MELDHIAVAALTLDEGAAYIRNKLGVEVPMGGEHLAMGTHNRLMRLGNGVYLEVIAIAPHLAAPVRPRWFALDAVAMREKLAERPRLVTWVVRTDDIESDVTRSSVETGAVTPMTRGNLSWKIGIRPDGSLPLDGLFPTLIQWPKGPHPVENMDDFGCRLKSLRLHHSASETLRSALASIRADGLVEIVQVDGRPYLSAEIETPNGLVTLD